jgi:uncharacterized protein (UPF0303 family)
MSDSSGAREAADQIRVLEQEQAELRLASFDARDVWQLGGRLVETALKDDLAIAIRISRGEQVAFHWAADRASLDNDGWLERKTRTVNHYGESSWLVGLRQKHSGVGFAHLPWIDSARYSAHGGAVPVIVRDAGRVAVAAVSGLEESVDHALVVEALQTLQDSQGRDHS